ncbi:MAG: hypothetical protein IJK02_10165 [Clostridia bacterium]|nr:hypothetical protein [Clostridia bacterium]
MQKRMTVPFNKSVQTVLQMVSVLYLMAWSVSPPLQISILFRLIALGLAAVWFLIEFFRRFEFTKMQIWCALFMAAIIIVTYLKKGADSVLGEIAIYMMVLAFFINIYSSDSWQNYRIVVPVTLMLLIFFNYRTASTLSADATIARRLVRDSEELYDFLRQGVGGYGHIYLQVCISPVVYAWTLKAFDQHKVLFVLGVLWIVTFWWVLLNAGYSIAIISSAVSMIILLFYRRRSILPAFVLSVVLIVVGVLMLVYVEDFRNFILQIFDGTKVVRKIEDLLSTAEGETADSFATRITRYGYSLQTCLQYPIIGGWLFDANYGGHSEILDTFAKYGVWGGVPTLFMIFYAPYDFRKRSSSRTVLVTANAHTLVIALVSLFDPFVFQVYFPLLILCPVMYTDIIRWTEEDNDDSLDG